MNGCPWRGPRASSNVSEEDVITDADFEHVEAAFRPGGLVLDAEWKPHAAERMAGIRRGEAAAANEFLALLIDGELVSAPRIIVDPDASAAPSIQIGVQLPAEEAERIAAAAAARWPGGGTRTMHLTPESRK
jgi:hypothetical protein